MKIGAVIAEFNPFHTGHKHLLDCIRTECDGVIAIMSGNFVQRGECAVFDKKERTKAALQNGVDLVIELPAVYALSSAEGFSSGAVSTLFSLGVANELWFGSECGNIKALSSVAHFLNNESTEFKEELDRHLRHGLSFPAARVNALRRVSENADILASPNNILAVEYIRALKKLDAVITARTIKRLGSGYNETEIKENIASASAIRNLLQKGAKVKDYTPCKGDALFMKDFDSLIAARVKTITKEELCAVPDCNEELASRIIAASKHNSFSEIVDEAVCKSYTQSRIRRILCNLLVGNRFSSVPKPTYIRVLGFNEKGSDILSKMKSTASLPVVSRGALLKDDSIFSLECRATDIYNLARKKPGGEEFRLVPVRL